MRFQAVIIALIGAIPLCSANPNEFLRFACQSFSGMFGNKCFEEDGAWGMWGPFTACSSTCGTGTRKRTRECDNPPASNGGAECPNIDTDNIDIGECNTSPCPVDGNWGSWGPYSSCTGKCGCGTRTRERVCDNPSASHGGASCSEDPIGAMESEDCGSDTCGVNGNWGAWAEFTSCSAICGGGTQTRSRSCDNPPPSNGGADCSNSNTDNIERQNCNTFPCPIDGDWGSWGPYSACSASCDGGRYSRQRVCNNPSPSYGGKQCLTGSPTQSDVCNTKFCPVNGGWSEWTGFSKCSKECGSGIRLRSRTCNSPLPSNGGADCPRSGTENEEIESCNTDPCPVNGGWGEYGDYTPCTKTCGGGDQFRYRVCNSPRPLNGGAVCTGDNDNFEKRACNEKACPVNGNWGAWTSIFTTCSVSCGGGTQTRSRDCDNPPPSDGGAYCPNKNSDNIERENCNTFPCPIDGDWGSWGEFTSCSVSCGGGNHYRQRACNNPSPSYGGKQCLTGSPTEVGKCNTNACPVDGEWGAWSAYGDCTKTCGGGSQIRIRNCDDPYRRYGGAVCPDSRQESRTCNTVDCFEQKCIKEGFVYDADTNYCIQLFTQLRTHEQADALCKGEGYRLATVNTFAKFAVAIDIIVDRRTDQTEFYVGAIEGDGKAYEWSDGTPVVWIGTPDLKGGSCVKLVKTADVHRLDTVYCTEKQYHFCELSN